jgi:hypothetical protein
LFPGFPITTVPGFGPGTGSGLFDCAEAPEQD